MAWSKHGAGSKILQLLQKMGLEFPIRKSSNYWNMVMQISVDLNAKQRMYSGLTASA